MVGKVALKKTLGILAGPVGWIITGALVSINLARPAYRVTVPAYVLIAILRLKLEQEAKQKAEQERLEQAKRLAKQKAEREANKTKKMWYLAITFLIGLAILAVFFIKGKHQSSNDPSNSQKSGVKKLKNPSHKN
ncbi:flagellar biosynthesis protein FlgG [Helicobacter pylori]|nr:flagellar biosynthesis protein FlgG [Helicobacter pylori]